MIDGEKIRKDPQRTCKDYVKQFKLSQEIFSQYGSVKEVTVLPVAAGKNAAAAFVIMHTVSRLQSQKRSKKIERVQCVSICTAHHGRPNSCSKSIQITSHPNSIQFHTIPRRAAMTSNVLGQAPLAGPLWSRLPQHLPVMKVHLSIETKRKILCFTHLYELRLTMRNGLWIMSMVAGLRTIAWDRRFFVHVHTCSSSNSNRNVSRIP